MNNDKKTNQMSISVTEEVLNLDPETIRELQEVSGRLGKAPSEIIMEMVYHIHRLLSSKIMFNENTTKEDLAFSFDFSLQHLHLLPQMAESIGVLSGRDTDIVISNLFIDLETKIVTFDLGLGLHDLEKVFVTLVQGEIQLFSNRYLSTKYTREELERIKEYTKMKIQESMPYADVTIGFVESGNNANESSNVKNKTNELTTGKTVEVEEVELTIRSHDIKYLPTFHKFNTLMDDVIHYFRSRIKTSK